MTNYLKTDWDYNNKELVKVFDELPLWAAPFGLQLLNGIHYKKNLRALDIGFGTGFPLTEIAMRLGKSATVYGIDPWESAIDRAEQKIKQFDITNTKIIRGVAENIPLTNNSIDLIVSNNGLNNVSDIEKTLAECARVITPNGQFIQTINLPETMFEFYDVLENVLTEMELDEYVEKMHNHIYKKRKPLNEYVNLIEQNGFKTNSIKQNEFAYSFVDGTTMLNHYFMRLAFLDGWKEAIPKDKLELVFTKIEAELNKQSEINGVCKLSIPFAVIDCVKI